MKMFLCQEMCEMGRPSRVLREIVCQDKYDKDNESHGKDAHRGEFQSWGEWCGLSKDQEVERKTMV